MKHRSGGRDVSCGEGGIWEEIMVSAIGYARVLYMADNPGNLPTLAEGTESIESQILICGFHRSKLWNIHELHASI